MTTVQICKNWRTKIKSGSLFPLRRGEWFSSAEHDWIFVESSGYAKKGQSREPLWLPALIDIQVDILQSSKSRWMWIARPQNDEARVRLRERFPDCINAGKIVACFIKRERSELTAFWDIYNKLSRQEPWNMESSWGVAAIAEKFEMTQARLSELKDVRGIFRFHDELNAVFIQDGWWATIGARRSEHTGNVISRWLLRNWPHETA